MDLDDYRRIAEAHYKATSGTARRLRVDANLSTADIAKRVGVSPSAVSRWENGNRLPRTKHALKWADLLDELEHANPQRKSGMDSQTPYASERAPVLAGGGAGA